MRIRGGTSICICVRFCTLFNGGISAVLNTGYRDFQRGLYVFFLVYVAVFLMFTVLFQSKIIK